MADFGPAAIGWVDYLLILASLAVCVWIGLRKPKEKKQPNEQDGPDDALGGRSMSMLPVAFSIMATLLSGNSITSAVGEVYKYGILTLLYPISGLLMKLIVGYAIVPVLHAYNYVSIYEYVEKRFDRSCRLILSALYIISHVIYLGIALYSPALSLTTVTGIPYWISVSSLGLVCAFYCVLGGLKAIIWTDVFQAGLMFFCVLTIIIKATWKAGGLYLVFESFFATPQHLEVHFPYTEDPIYRYSIWSVLFAGAVDTLKTTIVSQAGAQRLLCVDSVKTAIKSLMVGAILMLVFKTLTAIAAMAIYANFSKCDPLEMPERSGIVSEDQLFMYAVNRFMSDIPGLQGLALAGLISATLSTCSSLINAFAVLTLEDYAKPLFPVWTNNTQAQSLICKMSTLLYALLSIAMSFITPYLGGIAKALLGFISSLTGPLCGVMILGFFFSRADTKACKIAAFVSLVFVSWVMIGSTIYVKPDLKLPSATHGCSSHNFTEEASEVGYQVHNQDAITHHNTLVVVNQTIFNNVTAPEKQEQYIFPLYRISFMWLGPLGTFTTCLLGVILSFLMGGQECDDKKLLSPWVTVALRKPNSSCSTCGIKRSRLPFFRKDNGICPPCQLLLKDYPDAAQQEV